MDLGMRCEREEEGIKNSPRNLAFVTWRMTLLVTKMDKLMGRPISGLENTMSLMGKGERQALSFVHV